MDRRQQFLDEFLAALGAREVRYLQVTPDFISGTVVYDPNAPDEQQDFRWSISTRDAPSLAVAQLAGLIRANDLLIIDRLRVSRQDLLARFNAARDTEYSPEQFSALLDELLQIEVPMLDGGVESDCYFIHE